ncbi:FeoA domain protein [Corynebacterium atrinae]|uniref:ferrous iron transport protein A n=1 Tax=Corynebacterium atrinae TaxID=1336740 RepID=UPI0025B62A16|nr:ferrous iron transport protein A [Corynebacterium atrinae]WJY62902.1 FeoA domain protein [Corynebacterium atrinae]
MDTEIVLGDAAATPTELRQRFQELGLRPGTTIRLGQATAGGGRVVSVGSVRYAFDRRTLDGLLS